MTPPEAPARPTIRVNVRGLPHPQGSMRAIPAKHGNHVALKYAPGVYAWRAQVQQAIAQLQQTPILGPVKLELGFDLPRPASHFLPANSRRAAPELHPDAPTWPTKAPDLDKLIRAICDAVTDSGLWKDDAQVVSITSAKRYTTANPGVLIQITELAP